MARQLSLCWIRELRFTIFWGISLEYLEQVKGTCWVQSWEWYQWKFKTGWVKAQSKGEWRMEEGYWSWSLKKKVRWSVCYYWQLSFRAAKQVLCLQQWQVLWLSKSYWNLYWNSSQQLVRMEQALAKWLVVMLLGQVYQLFPFYCLQLDWWLLFQQPSDAELPSVYYKNIKLPSPPFLSDPSSALNSKLFLLQSIHNNFIMAQKFDSEKRITQIEKKMVGGALLKSEQQKKREIFEYDNQEFMVPMQEPANSNPPKGQMAAPQIKKSMVLSKMEVERSLSDIYNYYIRVYEQPSKEYSQFDAIGPRRLDIKGFLLFAKNFGILKTIFTLDRMILIFKKYADYGKFLSFDNFYFTINSMSHEQEVKTFFHLDSMLMNLDIETIEELEKQEFYNYLQLKDPQVYRKKYTQLFGPFNISEKPHSSPLKYNYRKFSLPELRKKALLQPRQKKKGQKDLFILKNDKQMHQNVFDEAKSIVVSWDSLRAKSVNNLGKPAELLQKKYLKIDPQEDPYLQEVRPPSRPSPKSAHKNERQGYHKQHYGNKIEKKIKEIQQSENIKNQQLLNRIEKKLKLPSSRKLQM